MTVKMTKLMVNSAFAISYPMNIKVILFFSKSINIKISLTLDSYFQTKIEIWVLTIIKVVISKSLSPIKYFFSKQN